MTWNSLRPYFAAAIFVLVAGCSSSSNDDGVTGEGSLRVLHAIPELGRVDFLIEETFLGAVGFKEITGIVDYDDIEYTFNFDTFFPGDTEATRILSTTFTVNAEIEYTFVLTGTADNPELLVWEQFSRDWIEELEEADENDTEVTVAEVSFSHIADTVGAVDMYFESPGTSPLAAAPMATVSTRELQTSVEIPADDYQLVITPAGDPNTILFASDEITIFAATSTMFAVFDNGGNTTADFAVRQLGTSLGVELLDLNVESAFSVYHAAFGTDPVDVVVGADFANPLLDDLAFGTESDDIRVDENQVDLTIIPFDNPGVFLEQRSIALTLGTYHRIYLTGLPGDLQVFVARDDRRRLATHARVAIIQAAARFTTADLYVVGLDIDIALTGPTFPSLLFGSSTSVRDFEPGDYNVVFTEPGTKQIIAGPLEVTLLAGENYRIIATDSSDISAIDVTVVLEEPLPEQIDSTATSNP